jgi:hypothetical protein
MCYACLDYFDKYNSAIFCSFIHADTNAAVPSRGIINNQPIKICIRLAQTIV